MAGIMAPATSLDIGRYAAVESRPKLASYSQRNSMVAMPPQNCVVFGRERCVSSLACTISGRKDPGGSKIAGNMNLKKVSRLENSRGNILVKASGLGPSPVMPEEEKELSVGVGSNFFEREVLHVGSDQSSSSSASRLSYSEAPSFSSLNNSVFAMEAGMGGGQSVDNRGGYQPKLFWFTKSEAEEKELFDRGINGALVGFAAAVAIAKVFTIDKDYWTGWTVFEIIRSAPLHNWHAYEQMLESNPVFAKMIISGVVYTVGDWSAQCYEGRGFLNFDRVRMVRSGLVGFCLHGSLSHYYYHFCEWLFPFEGWWVVPVKVAFDQTIWSGIWNSIYYCTLGLLRMESPAKIWKDLKETFYPLLTAGWKLWPLAHIVTYGVVPVEQRLLWVDMVELVWVTILSMISNEKSGAEANEKEAAVLALQDGSHPSASQVHSGEVNLGKVDLAEVHLGEADLDSSTTSIFWPADMEGQERVIKDGGSVEAATEWEREIKK